METLCRRKRPLKASLPARRVGAQYETTSSLIGWLKQNFYENKFVAFQTIVSFTNPGGPAMNTKPHGYENE